MSNLRGKLELWQTKLRTGWPESDDDRERLLAVIGEALVLARMERPPMMAVLATAAGAQRTQAENLVETGRQRREHEASVQKLIDGSEGYLRAVHLGLIAADFAAVGLLNKSPLAWWALALALAGVVPFALGEVLKATVIASAVARHQAGDFPGAYFYRNRALIRVHAAWLAFAPLSLALLLLVAAAFRRAWG